MQGEHAGRDGLGYYLLFRSSSVSECQTGGRVAHAGSVKTRTVGAARRISNVRIAHPLKTAASNARVSKSTPPRFSFIIAGTWTSEVPYDSLLQERQIWESPWCVNEQNEAETIDPSDDQTKPQYVECQTEHYLLLTPSDSCLDGNFEKACSPLAPSAAPPSSPSPVSARSSPVLPLLEDLM